ncbi:MAG: carbohydrate kinase [Gammaproteobacteria bacterium]|nr:carbohydrate kinase [Gammaproteobacteria bacterium]MCW9055216.1 carbohydrate kinase [Gammaproteobacteria bacterium]
MNPSIINARPVIFGEVLFDCFADDSRVLGGAPFNVAWHCQAFGLQPLFISRIGKDPLGDEIQSAMLDWNMDISGLQLDTTHATGIVDVSFDNGEPSYNIVENSAWDFIDYQSIPAVDPHSVLYHGSLALRNPVTASSLVNLKQQCSKSIFIDVNLRPPWWNLPLIENIIHNGRWLKLNIDELALIVPDKKNIEERVDHLLSHLDIELIIVTQGKAGAIAARQNEWRSTQPDKTVNVIDTVGAGDAFSSVLLLGLHKAWSLEETLNRAQQFASAVVGQRGATTQDQKFYTPFIKAWHL